MSEVRKTPVVVGENDQENRDPMGVELHRPEQSAYLPPMKRLVLPALAACFPLLAPAAERPNILWITSEDNSPYLGCYGHPQAKTPNQ